MLEAWDPFYDDHLMQHLLKKANTPTPEPSMAQDPIMIMKKWQSFYDLYLPSEDVFQVVTADLNVPPFLVYKEGVHAMNAPYIEVSVSVENGIFHYTYSGGSTHMDGFGNTGVIPQNYIRNNCVVLGIVLSLTGGAYVYISSYQEDGVLSTYQNVIDKDQLSKRLCVFGITPKKSSVI